MKKSIFLFVVGIALSISVSINAATIPFSEMVTPEIKIPEVQTPNLNTQKLQLEAYLLSTKRFTQIMRYSLTGENPNEVSLSFNDVIVREQFVQFEKDLAWLKTNSPEVYSPDHYPADFMRYQVNLFLKNLDTFQLDVSKVMKSHSQESSLQQVMNKHKSLMATYQYITLQILEAKAQRKKLEPYFSI